MEAKKTPIEDLREYDLTHYDYLASKCHHYTNTIPRAINFYYDYKSMNIWQRIKLAFK